MNEQTILEHLQRLITSALNAKGLPPVTIDAGTELLGGAVGIDSLDLAMLVRDMEEIVGHDPFKDGFIEFRTAGELAKLYAR
jgi:acyl carrier protein